MPNTKTNSGASGSQNRGFASMPKDEVKKIASKGGQSSHKSGGQSSAAHSRSSGTSTGSNKTS